MILVTGATGHVGGRVAQILAERGERTRLLVRDPAKAPNLPGAEPVQGDYSDPESLDRACAGIRRVFLVSGHAPEGQRARLHGNVMQAARRAGVEHIVYLSFQNAAPTSLFPMGRDHSISEGYLEETGVPFTALRDNLYMDMIPLLFDETGTLRGPAGDGKVCWVAREDVAQVAATVLQSPSQESRKLTMTGPESLTMAETAQRISRITGRELRYKDESLEEARAWRLEQLGAPEWEVEMMVGSYRAVAAGELAEPSDSVEQLIGRPPYGLEDYFAQWPALLGPLRG